MNNKVRGLCHVLKRTSIAISEKHFKRMPAETGAHLSVPVKLQINTNRPICVHVPYLAADMTKGDTACIQLHLPTEKCSNI